MAVVVRAGAAPLWWCGVAAAGIGAMIPGLTGRRIGVNRHRLSQPFKHNALLFCVFEIGRAHV